MDIDFEWVDTLASSSDDEEDKKVDEEDTNFYSARMREDELENDQITDWEEAFMSGWDDAL